MVSLSFLIRCLKWSYLKKSDIIIMPLSMRIYRLLINNELTTKEIKSRLKDVPQATLYRHIKKMYDFGLFEVVKQEIVKGIIKKTYALTQSGVLSPKDIEKMTDDEYDELFIQYVANLISDYKNNLEYNKNFKKDIHCSRISLYLSKKEEEDMNREIDNIIEKYFDNEKTEERELKLISIQYMPDFHKE